MADWEKIKSAIADAAPRKTRGKRTFTPEPTPEQVEPLVVMMDVEEIHPAGFNPAARTDTRATRALMADIRGRGILVPLIVGRDNILADGHRRLACAKALGIQRVPVVRYDAPAEELYTINTTARPLRTSDWFAAYAQGLAPGSVNNKTARDILEIERLIGNDAARAMAARGRSPHILTWARRAAIYCNDPTDEFVREALRWLDECNQQFALRKALDVPPTIPPETLKMAIVNRQKLAFTWTVDRQ